MYISTPAPYLLLSTDILEYRAREGEGQGVGGRDLFGQVVVERL